MKAVKFAIVFLLIIPLFVESNFASPDLVVALDESGDFRSIQEALNAVPHFNDRLFIIFVKNGLYKEKIFVEKSNIALVGESRDSTIIEFAELRKIWRLNHDDDYGAGVVNIKNKTRDVIFKSLTIRNNFGLISGDDDHQFAIRAGDGVTRIIIDDCNLIAHGGDTVALWNTNDGMYYHNNSYFEGYVDYVCPRGYCHIENSKFFGRNLTASIWHDGSKNENQKLVIRNSYFDGVEGFPLGRFHRDAHFILIDCSFSKNMADKKIFFAPSNPPRTLQWGEDRIYFINCHRENGDFDWHKDNFDRLNDQLNPHDITPSWTFNNQWDPISKLEQLDSQVK